MDDDGPFDVPTDDPAKQCRYPGCSMVAVSDGWCLGFTHEGALAPSTKKAYDVALAAVTDFYNAELRRKDERIAELKSEIGRVGAMLDTERKRTARIASR